MVTLIFKFTFVNNANPQVVLTSTELTGGAAPTVNISTTAIASGTVASVVASGALTYDSYTKSWGYRLASADLATYLYVGMATTTYATASPASVHALGMAVPDVLPSTLATSAALATAQADLDTLTGSDGATLATAQANYAPATPAQVAAELATYDAPTKAELDSGLAGLSIPTAAANASQVRAELTTELGRIDVAVSSVGGASAAEVASALAGTQSLTIVSAVAGNQITVYSRDAWAFTDSNSSLNLDAYTALAFVAKSNARQDDNTALLYLRTDTGLRSIGGGAAGDAGAGSLTNTNTSFTVSVDADQTDLDPVRIYWWLKGLGSNAKTLASGVFILDAGGVHAIS